MTTVKTPITVIHEYPNLPGGDKRFAFFKNNSPMSSIKANFLGRCIDTNFLSEVLSKDSKGAKYFQAFKRALEAWNCPVSIYEVEAVGIDYIVVIEADTIILKVKRTNTHTSSDYFIARNGFKTTAKTISHEAIRVRKLDIKRIRSDSKGLEAMFDMEPAPVSEEPIESKLASKPVSKSVLGTAIDIVKGIKEQSTEFTEAERNELFESIKLLLV